MKHNPLAKKNGTSNGKSPSNTQSQPLKRSRSHIYCDSMDVQSDDSDEGKRLREFRKQRFRKPISSFGLAKSLTTKDILNGGGVGGSALSRRRKTNNTLMASIHEQFQSQSSKNEIPRRSISRRSISRRSISRRSNSSASDGAGQSHSSGSSSSPSQDIFLHTQNMEEIIPQSQSQEVISVSSRNGINDPTVIDEVDDPGKETRISSSAADWSVFSLRNSVWDFFLLWTDRPIPLDQETFKNMVMHAVSQAFPLPSGEISTEYEALRVETIEVNNSTMQGADDVVIRGNWCTFIDSRNSNSSKPKSGSISIEGFELGQLFQRLVREKDIIFYMNANPFSETDGTIISTVYFFHICSNDETSGQSIKIGELPQKINYDISSPTNPDKPGTYTVKRYTYNLCSDETNKDPLSPTDINSDRSTPDPFDIFLDLDEDSLEDESIENDDSDKIICIDLCNSDDDEESGQLSDLCPDINEADEDEETGQLSDLCPDINEADEDERFNLHDFLERGEFVPGPMRPKLQKVSGSRDYVYHKLAKLEEMISYVAEEDHRKRQLPCPMIRDPCHVHGVVDKINLDHRHLNSYLIRISDETKQSVLVRLHNPSTAPKGPEIQVGDIIRIHRLTVQNEWDPEISDNVMVLSSPNHHNYVIFRITNDESLTFSFDTCAKSITIDDEIDRKRIGELYRLKSRILAASKELFEASLEQESENEDRPPSTVQDDLSDHSGRSSPTVAINAEFDGDGICNSDIMSQSAAVICISDDEVEEIEQKNLISVSPSLTEAINNAYSSEESFVTAICYPEGRFPVETAAGENQDDITIEDLNEGERISPNESAASGKLVAPIYFITSFKDLKKNYSTISLVFKVKSVAFSGNVYQLVVQDFENNSPPEEFKRIATLSTELSMEHDALVIDVTNTAKFTLGSTFHLLKFHQGTDALFVLENVKIKGTKPPYILEADGNTCIIREAQSNDLQFLQMDDESFSSVLEEHNATSNANEDVEAEFDSNLNSGRNFQDLDDLIGPVPYLSSPIDDDMLEFEIVTVKQELEEEEEESNIAGLENITESTPLDPLSPTTRSGPSSSKQEPWTGKRKGKRRPRLFYEDTDTEDKS